MYKPYDSGNGTYLDITNLTRMYQQQHKKRQWKNSKFNQAVKNQLINDSRLGRGLTKSRSPRQSPQSMINE